MYACALWSISLQVFSVNQQSFSQYSRTNDTFSNAISYVKKDGEYVFGVDEWWLMVIMMIKNKW